MKHCRYLLLLLALLVSAGLRAQYNPNNPDEPGTKPWLLTLKSIPADAGSFNISKQTSHAAGEQIGLKANDNGNYKFADWEDEEGNIIATTAQYNYTMPAKHVTLVARYTYSPNNPNEPDSPTQHQYSRIYLETSPADGGSFNVSSGNSYEVGTIVTLHAYNNANFKFEKWTEDGQTISTDNELEYTVKATDSHLTAHFNYSPGNPGEPSEASISHHLYLKANPSEGGYFNMSSDNSFVAGEVVYLSAYSSSYYQFRNWTQDGEIVSTSASFVYIMPDKNTTLVANYDYIYSPDNPNEPGQSQTERYYIYGMRENVLAGQTINYPVYLENTGQTTGLSIDLNFPLGFTVDATNASLTARTNSHTLEVKDLGNNNFRFLVRGAENIQGVNGKVMEIPVSVPDTVTVGNVFTIELSKGAIYKPDGSQAIVTVRNGSIKILRAAGDIPDSPDYVVSNIQTTSSTVMPQDVIHLSWQVKNEGNLVGYGGWSERIYLVSESGKKVCIGTTYYDTNVLDPGATVSRSTDMALAKLIGIEGAARICITIIPSVSSGEIIEYQSNNSAETENAPLHVGKRLYLTMPESALAEGEHSTVRCQLSRSGNWTSSEDYELSLLSGDNRLTVPETVTIPREQSAAYFYLTINDNNASDADSVFTLQVSGNGYEAVEGVLVISDDEQPSLQVRVSKSEVTEGETFQLTITAERPSDGPIPLIITAEQPRRFVLPTKVEIPANETSVTVDVTAVDNDEIELQESIAIRVSSPGHDESECVILLNDNDMPTLSLTLTPDAVSEDGGPLALFGMIKRTDNLDKRVIMKLSDDSNGLLSYTTNTIVLERNKQNVQFNIGVVDNETVDGDHTVTVKAEVYATSCDCSIPSNGADSLTATVTIIDNDGPTLKIKPEGTAILEGSEGNVFVVSHNAPTTKDVKVRISSDKDDILEYDHELTIPAGSSSANLLVNVKSNDISDDSNIVTFKVEADDFAMGSCWLLITDQTLPDAVVSIRADKEEAKAEETVGLSIVVKNVGNSTLRSSTPIQFAFSGQKNTTKLTIGKAVEPGDSVVIDYNYYLPAMVGEYYFEATVNADGRVPELLLANNTSEKVFITLLPRFSATAKAEKEQYKQGETIVISGTASGEEGKNAKVEVYLMNDGARLTLDATTDETGNYSVTWEPMNNLSGHFDIGACYPGSNLKESMNAIDIIGISASGSYDICQITLGEIYTGKLVIKNPGIVNQTQLSVEQKAQSDNCVLTFSTPNAINAGESVEIGYTINSSALSQGSSWQQMPIEITTAEGAKLEYLLYYYVYAQKAVLESNTKYIQTTMTLGTPREYPIVIRNIGKAETGKITLALPAWIQTATPVEMASLEQGDSTTIILRFMPTDRMKLNTKVTGRFGVNCDNGDGLAVGFEITPVSDTKGTLTIDVVDEFTFYTDESPHVEEANVQVMNPATYEIVTQGKTNKDGTFTAELKEGYYSITVEAEKHQTYTSCLIVDPGIIKTEEVFLPYDAVTYDYNVTETEVNDEYEIETIAKFETRVPKPVLTMTLPEDAPLPNSIFPVVITNHGLINAVDVNFSLTVSGGYSLEFLNATSLDSLAPQSSYILYAKLKPNNKEEASSRMKEISETEYCLDIWGYGSFVNLCNKYTNEEIFKAYSKWGYCGLNHYFDFWNELAQYLHLRPSSPTDDEPSDVNPWDFFNDIIRFLKICNKKTPDVPDNNIPEIDPTKDPFWTPCKAEVLAGSANCVANLGTCWIPGVGCAVGIGTSCVLPATTGRMTGFAFLGCLGSIVGCGFGPVGSCVMAGIGCAGTAVDTYFTCNDIHIWSGVRSSLKSKKSINIDYNHEDPFDNFFYKMAVTNEEMKAYFGYIEEIFGNTLWLESNPDEITKLTNYLQSFAPEDVIIIDEQLLSLRPSNISLELFKKFIERYNNTTTGYDSNYQGIENYIRGDVLVDYASTIEACESYAEEEGYSATQEMIQTAYDSFMVYLESIKVDEDSDSSPSICSTVTLSFKQKNVMTRQAFRGMLSVNNGHKDEELKDIKVYLEVRDEEGKLATQREFQIDAESLDGFDGKLAMDAGWTLAADSKGTATILFIPSKYAAPTKPKDYSFGGSFSYTDPSTGLTVTRQLNPVTLTVNPSPNLEMTYFMQRDVFGDDALTEEIEPMIPSEFALLVNNKGYGDAKNMNLTTRQPQIIDNQKGLAIDFELISTQLNGGEKTLSMGNSMASDFGDIPAHSQAYAQWWLQSSLMGHFIEYDVKANHLTSRDNPYLSLIDTVTIHELIHGFTVRTDTETPVRGFLVNDIADAEDLPDEVYFTDATQKSVSKVGYASITKRSDTEFLLNVRPSAMGWNYGSLADPANGKQRLVSVTRLSDNAAIATDNVWQTPCTLRDGKDPVHENRLHFVFELQEEGDTYLLSFEQRPDVELQVERFKGGPGENEILEQQLKEISVLFNKPIDASTFTYDDITLTCQGVKQDVSKIGISSISSTEYKLILEPLTNKNGYFVLTVYTDDIIDSEGYTGFEGKQYAWMQIVDGSNIEDITSSEELTIKVSPLPVSDRMFINGNFRRIRKLIVYDVNGVQKMLLEDIAPNEAIDASTLPSGVYLLTIQTEIGTRRIKIIKV